MCHSPDSGNVSLHGGEVQRGEPVVICPVQGLLLRLQDQPEGRDSRDGLESRFCESATNPKTANCESICELRNQFASRSFCGRFVCFPKFPPRLFYKKCFFFVTNMLGNA